MIIYGKFRYVLHSFAGDAEEYVEIKLLPTYRYQTNYSIEI